MRTSLEKKAQPARLLMLCRMVWFGLVASMFTLAFIAYQDEKLNQVTIDYLEILNNQMTQVFLMQAVVVAFVAFYLTRFLARKSKGEDKISRAYVPYVVRLALIESIHILGFVNALNMHTTAAMVPFAALALLLMLFSYPSQELLESMASS